MADFVAVLKKTIDGLSDNTPEMREKVYRKARDTVAAKLAAITPPPPPIVVQRQGKALEDAIAAVEASYARTAVSEDDFESVLADLGRKPGDLGRKPDGQPASTEGLNAAHVRPAGMGGGFSASGERPDSTDMPGEKTGEAGQPPAGAGGRLAVDTLAPIQPVKRPEPPLARPPLAGKTDGIEDEAGSARQRNRRRISGLLAAAIAVIVVGAAGYGIWLNRTEFSAMLGLGERTVAVDEPAGDRPAPEAETAAAPTDPQQPAEEKVAAAPVEQPASPVAVPAEEDVVKFTQRLTAEGQEVDEGPAGGEGSIGEGTSLASATQDGSAPAQPAEAVPNAQQPNAQQPGAEQSAAGGEQAVPVGQRAIFYEERTNVAQGSAESGTAVWTLVQESPGSDLPPEPAIRAEVNIPGKDVQLRMTIRRNGDNTLPASHIVEMIFLTSGSFEGGGIDNVLRIALKSSEAAAGNPLMGIPARIADGYFLVALSDGKAERDTNTQLLLRQSWIDIPIVYRSGRRALMTMEKGAAGDRVFQEAIQAWQNASSG